MKSIFDEDQEQFSLVQKEVDKGDSGSGNLIYLVECLWRSFLGISRTYLEQTFRKSRSRELSLEDEKPHRMMFDVFLNVEICLQKYECK